MFSVKWLQLARIVATSALPSTGQVRRGGNCCKACARNTVFSHRLSGRRPRCAQRVRYFGGLHVYAPSMIDTLISKKRVSTVLLAVPSTSPARRSEILRTLEKLPVKLRTVPGLEDVMAGRGGEDGSHRSEDRRSFGPRSRAAHTRIAWGQHNSKSGDGHGAGGSIGSELCRQILAQRPARLVLFEQSELALYSIDQN